MASKPKRHRIQTLEDPQIKDTGTLREIEEEMFLDYCHEDGCLHTENELRVWEAIVRYSDFRSTTIPYIMLSMAKAHAQ